MELKKFQRKVLDDLNSYLDVLDEKKDIVESYNEFWHRKNVNVGFGGVPTYNNSIKGVPHICFKVPTGGGKTFLACCSLKILVNKIPSSIGKLIVWLVPSETILTQTVENLKNPNHPYRDRINRDFNSRVEVYTKAELLEGRNFNTTTAKEQLNILVLSFDSFRITKTKQDNRKVYEENGNLEPFTKEYKHKSSLVEGVSESALIQVINQMMPIVVVDESHNTNTELSQEMLVNINPSFILDLTATPRKNSNVISYVDAMQLKKESMVKLPVIAYNRPSQSDVITDAIDLRRKLEAQAIAEEKSDNDSGKQGKYIRPIVLFQAEPKTKKDATTFSKLKEKLIKIGIPSDQIAIKTSEVNELKGIKLDSKDCPIRYIITVNALKEGWDCPFAYILATLANRSSEVDVEQILGRVLRQPYVEKRNSMYLNSSYVLTSSADFMKTLNNIIKALNASGFTSKDVRAVDTPVTPSVVETKPEPETTLFDNIDEEKISNELKKREEKENENISGDGSAGVSSELGELFKTTEEEYQRIEDIIKDMDIDEDASGDLRNMIDSSKIKHEHIEKIKKLFLPKFFINSETNLLDDTEILLTKEYLTTDFMLSDKPIPKDLANVTDDIYKFDLQENEKGSVPNYQKLSKESVSRFKNYIASIPPEVRVKACKRELLMQLDNLTAVSYSDLSKYIDRIVDPMSSDDIADLQNNIYSVASKIRKFIDNLIKDYRVDRFFSLIERNEIKVKPSYTFQKNIMMGQLGTKSIGKSLYEEEYDDLNRTEHIVINEICSLGNIAWWHRIIDSNPHEFSINGFINHYPDFVICTEKGNIVMVEVKGEQLATQDTANKLALGRQWASMCGEKFKYYMVFINKAMQEDGSVSLETLCSYIKNL